MKDKFTSSMNKLTKIILILATLFFVVISSWQMIRGSIIFHTDIARDFLLLEDMVKSGKPALIGPRSGGIPGVFHGPLWLYVNLPAYITGSGNPVAVGWFWVVLFVCCLIITYWVGKKLFSEETGLVSALLVSVSASQSISSLFNPFGAVILSPLFFFFYFQYLKKYNVLHLLLCLLTLGFIIQFQMAWGVPVLVMAFIPLVLAIIKKRKYVHFFSFLILLIPLSTFILFDLRHQFLQTKSVISYLKGAENMGKLKLHPIFFFFMRIKEMVLTFTSMFTRGNIYLSLLFPIILLYSYFKMPADKRKKAKKILLHVVIFYVGYWVLTLAFKGTIWGYYYWPFLPVLAIIISMLLTWWNRRIAYIIIFVIVIFNGFYLVKSVLAEKGNYNRTGSWLFYYSQAQKIYGDAKEDFGYYIYTADQYGYSSRYAMNYTQKLSTKKAYPYEKKRLTYLIIFPSTNPYTSEHWWKENQVKIDKKPDKVFKFADGSYIEKYTLTDGEQKVASDPNLINSLIFR